MSQKEIFIFNKGREALLPVVCLKCKFPGSVGVVKNGDRLALRGPLPACPRCKGKMILVPKEP